MTRLENVARRQRRLMVEDALTTAAVMSAWVAALIALF
jgi:hypothetical protein